MPTRDGFSNTFVKGYQWTPRADVLRCVIDAGKPDGEPVIQIDDHELTWKEFGRMLTTHAGWGMRILGYTPRQAELTVLHQMVREHLETFLATTARADPAGLPAFLEEEFRGFLDCGVWARGSVAPARIV